VVRKTEDMIPLGRFGLGWEDNIKMEPEGIKCNVTEWINLAQDR
jgi:hypothetical protein